MCPQSANDDRPKLRHRHGEGAVELFALRCHSVATAVRTCGCAAVRAADSTAGRGQHSTTITAEDRVASHRVASRRVASPQRTHLSAEVELVQLGRGGEELAEVVDGAPGTIGSESGSDAIM